LVKNINNSTILRAGECACAESEATDTGFRPSATRLWKNDQPVSDIHPKRTFFSAYAFPCIISLVHSPSTEAAGLSNRPWLSRQTGPISSGVTGTRGTPAHIVKYSPPSLPSLPSLPTLPCYRGKSFDLLQHMTAHLDVGATGPHGKCLMAAKRPNPPVHLSQSNFAFATRVLFANLLTLRFILFSLISV